MTLERLQDLLDRFGADPARWPQGARADAERLIAADPAAARAAETAAKLDGALRDAAQPMPLDAAFIGRIVAGIDHATRHELAVRPNGRFVAWAGAAMIALLASGYLAGLALPQSQGEDAIAGLMFGNSLAASSSDTGTVL
jgi:hypothetical protein